MLISEPRFAAAYQPAGSEARVFDDIACLVQAVAREAEPGALRFWFHDANTAAWMTGAEAVFVKSERFRTPMAGGVVAYRGEAAARQAATESGGRVIGSLDDLLAEGRKGGGM
jgi:hypothetical protein